MHLIHSPRPYMPLQRVSERTLRALKLPLCFADCPGKGPLRQQIRALSTAKAGHKLREAGRVVPSVR